MPVSGGHPEITRFGGVDAAGEPGALIGFLDIAHAVPGRRAAAQILLDELRLGQARAALDVGCGTGIDVTAIAERLPPGGRAVGIDASEVMIAEAPPPRQRPRPRHLLRHRRRGGPALRGRQFRRLPGGDRAPARPGP